MNDGTPVGRPHTPTRPGRMPLSGAPLSARGSSPHEMGVLSAGVPVILLHGVSGGSGYLDEIITFGLLAGLVVGLVLLSFRGARNKNKGKARNRRGRRRSRR